MYGLFGMWILTSYLLVDLYDFYRCKYLYGNLLLSWATAANNMNGAGSYEEEYSALWIYKTACIERKISGQSMWLGWAPYVKYNALCSQDWTVDKIYQRVLEITNEEENFLSSYARFLMDEGRFEEVQTIFELDFNC